MTAHVGGGCAKLLTVREAVQDRKDHPGTTQAQAAEKAGVTKDAIAKAEQRAVTKVDMSTNVTDYGEPDDSPFATDAEIAVLDFLGLAKVALRVRSLALPPLTKEMQHAAKQVVKVWAQFTAGARLKDSKPGLSYS